MKKIIILTDYRNNFGSKWDAPVRNGGFDKVLLEKCFFENDYQVNYVEISKISEVNEIEGIPLLYTSSEDFGLHYKDFIEDIIYYLELKGANVIPSFKFLKANNNKVFMELLRKNIGLYAVSILNSWVYGTLEDLKKDINKLTFPIVVKTSKGAGSKGVSLANNQKQLIKIVKSISRSKHIIQDFKDNLRRFKYRGYKAHSLYRNKFILQSFVPKLKYDWKILVFGNKYFVLTRHVRKNDFRASGSHNNYLAGSKAILPEGLLEYAKIVYEAMNIPHVSMDIVYNESEFYLIEYQALYFGTSTFNLSDVYFEKTNDNWVSIKKTETIEWLFADAVIYYLKKNDKLKECT